MNDFQAVYLAGSDWYEEAHYRIIVDELEHGFELVVEWPGQSESLTTESVLARLVPLRSSIACLVLDVDVLSGEELAEICSRTGGRYAINLTSKRLGVRELAALAGRLGAGLVRYPEHAELPAIKTDYQVVCMPCQGVRERKGILVELRGVLEPGRRAGLFLQPAAESPQRAQEVRTLIELMELA